MENIEKIIQAIDIQLIQKNKPYMLLAEANRLLTSTRLIADNKALKKIVESGLIPHAYQTQKSPKQYRYTFVSRLQNLSLDIIENLYRAKDSFVSKGNKSSIDKRLEYQHQAMTSLKLLCYFADISKDSGCILFKQYEQISKKSTECMQYLGAWINSDRKRLSL